MKGRMLKTVRFENNMLLIFAAPKRWNHHDGAEIDKSGPNAKAQSKEREIEWHKELYVIPSTLSWLYHQMSEILTDLPIHRHLMSDMIANLLQSWISTTNHHLTSEYCLLTPITKLHVLSSRPISSRSWFDGCVAKYSRRTSRETVPSLNVLYSIPREPWPDSTGLPGYLYRLGFPSSIRFSGSPIFFTGLTNKMLLNWYVIMDQTTKSHWPIRCKSTTNALSLN